MTAIEKLEKELSVKLITSCESIPNYEIKRIQVFDNIKFIKFVSITEFCDICSNIISNGFDKYKFIKVNEGINAIVVTKSTLIVVIPSKNAVDVREFVNTNTKLFYSTLLGIYD